MRVVRFPLSLLTGLVLLLGATPAAAQINVESFARLGFNFSPPGGNSAALGGAFIPVADDATAAETNPAGLTQLLVPEISFEFKAAQYSRFLREEAGGGIGGTEYEDEVAFPSYLSLVYPFDRVTLALFRHELVNFRSTLIGEGFPAEQQNYILFPFTSVIDIEVQNIGASLALKLGSAFSVGVSAGTSLLDMEVDFPRYQVPQYEEGYVLNQTLVDQSDNGIFVNAGALLRLGDRVKIGGVYKKRPEFEDLPFSKVDVFGEEFERPDSSFTLNVPDAYGGGMSVRVTDWVTLSADALLIKYSDLAEDVALNFDEFISGGETGTLQSEDYVAEDGTDIHGGIEIVVPARTPLALRAGVARIAPSNVYYVGPAEDQRILWGTEPADDEIRYTFGLGTVLFRRLQFDGAVVVGDTRNEVVASLVWFLD